MSFFAALGSLWHQRQLVAVMTVRDIQGRYRGSAFGLLWAFITPLIMLAVYTFVFSVVFRARWSGAEESKAMFALLLSIGLILFTFFSECVNKAGGLIASHANFVKKVVFPLEILPVISAGGAFVNLLIGLFIWFGFFIAFIGVPPVTALWLPVMLVPLVLLTLGLSWFLAATGAYLKDISQAVAILIPMLMFLTPIFYPLAALPENFQAVVRLNPMADMIEQIRAVLVFGRMPDWPLYLVSCLVSMLIACGGFAWFRKLRSGFADVI